MKESVTIVSAIRALPRLYCSRCRLGLLPYSLVMLASCGLQGTDTYVAVTPSKDAGVIRRVTYSAEEVEWLAPKVLTNADFLGVAQVVALNGPYVIVADTQGPDALHVIIRDSGTHLVSRGNRGQGPGEFSGLWDMTSSVDSEGGIWAFDIVLQRLTLLDVEHMIATPMDKDAVTISLSSDEGTAKHIVWMDENVLLATGHFIHGRFGQFSSTGELKALLGAEPPGDTTTPIPVRQQAYTSYLNRHPSRSLVSLATRYTDRIEIFDVDGNRLVLSQGPDFFDPSYTVRYRRNGVASMVTRSDLRYGYIDATCSDTYIFALYSGRSGEHSYYADIIHVFDWDGILRAVYRVNEELFGIAVDSAGTVLYAIQHIPEPAILQYDLEGSLEPSV